MTSFPDLKQWREVVAKCFAEGLTTDGSPKVAWFPFGSGRVASLPAVTVSPGAGGAYIDFEEGTFCNPQVSMTAYIFCGDPNKQSSTDLGDTFISRIGEVHELIYMHSELGQVHDVEITSVDQPSVLVVGGVTSYTITVPMTLILP